MKPLRYDFGNCRLGDKAVSGWMLSSTAHRYGRPVVFSDPSAQDAGSFPVREFFRDLDDREVAADEECEEFQTGNLWITARKLFNELGGLGPARMTTPVEVKRYPVAMHILTDAPYNKVRNWTWSQAFELSKRMESELGVWPWIVPPLGAHNQLPAATVLIKLAAAQMFIGGDTGFSHAYAMMNPDSPLVWIGHDMANDKATYGAEFDSSPLSKHVHAFHLENNEVNIDRVLAHVAFKLEQMK